MPKFISVLSNAQIVVSFKEIHGETYNYSLVEYKTMHTKVKIVCTEHGEFEQTPNAHIRQGQGCPKCKAIKQKTRQKDTTESFLQKAIQIHGNRYDYSLVIYGETAHEKVDILCKEHGVFQMTPNNHLSAKHNCPKCNTRETGWTRATWKNQCEGKIAKLYIIKCFNETEMFYKIGITSRKGVRNRFNCRTTMPYNYEIIKLIKSEDAIYIYDLERFLHKHHKKYKYKPLIPFAGDTECFTEIKI